MKTRIALDVQPLFENNKTGIGWTVKKLVDNLVEDQEFQYQLNYFGRYHINEEKKTVLEYLKRGCVIKHCSWLELPLYRRIWNIVPLPYSWLFGKGNKITQFFNYVIPPGVKGKVVLYVYDMAYKAYPETINKRTKAYLNRNLDRSCYRADLICTISEFSKSEIIKYLGIRPEKIRVIPCGVDNKIFHSGYTSDEINAVKAKYGISGEYFLYLGTLEPRKNVARIVKAYSLLLKRQRNTPALVIAGKKGWLYEDIFSLIISEGIESFVTFTGYVKNEDVPILMQGSFSFVFPSLYEGFGLPVLEAMACGTPVLTSFNTSLKELAGEAALLVDPENVEAICEAMYTLLADEALKMRLVEHGIKQSEKYTWNYSAKSLKQVYKDLI